MRPSPHASSAEGSVRQAAEAFGGFRKTLDRDLAVLTHLRAADRALADAMQPSIALERAWEQVNKAKQLGPEFLVAQGIIRILGELEGARRSPAAADFGRLRSLLRDEAIEPASRLAVRNALRLEDELLSWLKVQELIATHLRTLSEAAGDSLRATQSER